MKKFKEFLLRNKHFFILLLFIPLQIWFAHLEATVVPRYITDIALDNKIPFVKEFVIAYILLFPYIAYGIIYTGLHSRKDFYRLVIFLLGTMTISCTVYSLFPNGQNLRPIIKQHDPFSLLIRFIYAADTPTDVCPSMHVIDAIAINAALQHSEAFAKNKFGKRVSTIVMIAMCLSTVFIKQHSIFDVFWGLITAMAFYIPLYLLPNFVSSFGSFFNTHDNNIDKVPKNDGTEKVAHSDNLHKKLGETPVNGNSQIGKVKL